MKRMAVGAVLVVALVGCSGSPSDGGATTPDAPVVSDGHLVAADYGSDWPLTVDSADVHCYPSPGGYNYVTVTINGTEYAVNGTARGAGKWADFNGSGYWRKDPDFKGLKVSIGPVIDAGLALC